MNYAEIKHEIKEIVDIVNDIPPVFQERCFEILLNHLLAGVKPSTSAVQDVVKEPKSNESTISVPLIGTLNNSTPLPTSINIFMRKRSITKELLNELIHIEKKSDNSTEVHFIREPDPHQLPVATAQLYWALLLGFKQAIERDEFSVDYEALRNICKDKGVLDSPNFAGNLKNNSKYFKSPLTAQSTPQLLSEDGQAKLAEVIKSLVSGVK